jgi:hypothetical protein
MPMTRSFVAPVLLATLLAASAAQAQAPGQIPGTLYPAPAVIPPPPPVAPAPVPSAVTPLPSPTYGVPRGVTAPVLYGGTSTIRMKQPPKRKTKRRPRTSDLR